MANLSKGPTYQKYLLDIMTLYKQRSDLQAYLEILLSIVAVGVFAVFAIKPTLVTIGSLITKNQALEQTNSDLDTKIKNLGIAQTLYNNNQDKIALLKQAVPDNPDVGGYIRQVEGLIKKDNLTTVTLTVAPVDLVTATPSGSLATTVTVTGSYDSLQSFIKDVENLRRPNIVNKMSLETDNNILNLSIVPESPYSSK